MAETSDPKIGDRRPREGRCEECDRPLSDLHYYMRGESPEALDEEAQPGHCPGTDYGCTMDWRARALAAEARVAALEADAASERQHGLLAGAMVALETAEWNRACARLNDDGLRTDIVPYFEDQAEACELVAMRIDLFSDDLAESAAPPDAKETP